MTPEEIKKAVEILDSNCPHKGRTDEQRRRFAEKCRGFEFDQIDAVIGEVSVTCKAHDAIPQIVRRMRALQPVKTYAEVVKSNGPSFWEQQRREWNAAGMSDFETCITYWHTVKERGRQRGGDSEVASLSRVYWRHTKNDFIALGNSDAEAHANATRLWGFDRGNAADTPAKKQTKQAVAQPAARPVKTRPAAVSITDEWAEFET